MEITMRNRNKKVSLWILPIFWMLVLFICTCTYDIEQLLTHFYIHFNFQQTPRFSDLLITSDAHPTEITWIFIKAGHFFGFALLYCICLLTNKSWKKSATIAVGYAALTEVCQLFFERDGRLIDLSVDSMGVFLALWICTYISKYRNKKT